MTSHQPRGYRVGVLGVTLALLAAGCNRPVRQPRPPTQRALWVMTYNVNFGLAGDPKTLDAIRRFEADLVLLQETTPAWEAAIRAQRTMARRYPHMAFRHYGGAGGLAVLSRFPFEQREVVPSPGGWFPAWRVAVRSPLGPLQVMLVHLRPPVSDGGSWVSGYFTTRSFRRNQAEHFARVLDPALPTLVVGDFNEDAAGRAVRYLGARGLRSVLGEFRPKAKTWRWDTRLGRITHELDHILYSEHLEPLDARVIEAGRSDHLPVVALFQRARPGVPRPPRPSSSSLFSLR
jgi:endonuclease/exonuclease/phosphatase (EEP) superfamily protein YafD